MDYQQLYARYQNALKLRELSSDKNFRILKDVFMEKILSAISITAQGNSEAGVNQASRPAKPPFCLIHSFNIMAYLAGLRDVFNYVDTESGNIDKYRNELDTLFSEMKG